MFTSYRENPENSHEHLINYDDIPDDVILAFNKLKKVEIIYDAHFDSETLVKRVNRQIHFDLPINSLQDESPSRPLIRGLAFLHWDDDFISYLLNISNKDNKLILGSRLDMRQRVTYQPAKPSAAFENYVKIRTEWPDG